MRLNERCERFGERADHQRLRQARDALQQAMPAGEHADQQLLDDLSLPDDDLAEFFGDLAIGLVEPLDGFLIRFCGRG